MTNFMCHIEKTNFLSLVDVEVPIDSFLPKQKDKNV